MASLCKRGVTLVVRLIRDASGLVRFESKNKTTECVGPNINTKYILLISNPFFFFKEKGYICIFFFKRDDMDLELYCRAFCK